MNPWFVFCLIIIICNTSVFILIQLDYNLVVTSHTFKVDDLTSLLMFRDVKLEHLFRSVSNNLCPVANNLVFNYAIKTLRCSQAFYIA